MSEQRAPEGVIPYVDHHIGERRVLTLHLTDAKRTFWGSSWPMVAVDGRQYLVYWGSVSFEVPADRAVHISVHVEMQRVAQAASALLPPGASLELTYATDGRSGEGSLS